MKLRDFAPDHSLLGPIGPVQPTPGKLYEFYRVEHPRTRVGPYQGGSYRLGYALNAHHGWDAAATHPSPRVDTGLGYIDNTEFCGFNTIEQMKAWFDGWGEALKAEGFVVRVYEIDGRFMRVGERQSVAKIAHDEAVIEVDSTSIITSDDVFTNEVVLPEVEKTISCTCPMCDDSYISTENYFSDYLGE